MQQLRKMTEEYRQSADKLRGKLQTLQGVAASLSGGELETFNKRRLGLYHMLWELEEKIRLLEEYGQQSVPDHRMDWVLPVSRGIVS